MPPVLGPASPSSRRLWSWLDAIASTFLPSTITMKLASSPSRNSSMTTRASGTKRVVISEHHVDCCVGFSEGESHHDAFAGSKSVRLDHNRSAFRIDIGVRSCGISEGLVLGSGDAMAFHERLGEILRRFKLSGSLRRPEDFEGLRREMHRPRQQPEAPRGRRRSANFSFLASASHCSTLLASAFSPVRFSRRASVAGRDDYFLYTLALRKLPRQRVSAPARADDQNFHALAPRLTLGKTNDE